MLEKKWHPPTKIMENHINEGGAWIGESLQDILEQISDDLSDVLASEKSDSDNSQYDGKDCKRVLSERELFTLDAPAEEDIKEDKEHDRVMYLSCETAEKNFRSAVADMLETCRSLESIKAILEEEFINFPGVKSKK